jgi:hypothetical protein
MLAVDIQNLIPNIGPFWNAIIFASVIWLLILIIVVVILVVTNKRRKGVDVSALTALASSEPIATDSAPNADPEEVMAILSIERIAAKTALGAVKDARKGKRISPAVSDSLASRYKARINKIDADIKRRSGAQEYKSLAESLEQTRDRLRGEIMPTSPQAKSTPPPPPQSGTPGIPPTAPPVPSRSSSTPPPPPPTSGPPKASSHPSKPSSPIPTPPKISPVGGPPSSSKSKPATVVPPSIAPPSVSSPPMPPKTSQKPPTPPTTSQMAPPPVPQSTPSSSSAPPPPAGDSEGQSISGLRMEMLRELARLKKFMSEEGQE